MHTTKHTPLSPTGEWQRKGLWNLRRWRIARHRMNNDHEAPHEVLVRFSSFVDATMCGGGYHSHSLPLTSRRDRRRKSDSVSWTRTEHPRSVAFMFLHSSTGQLPSPALPSSVRLVVLLNTLWWLLDSGIAWSATYNGETGGRTEDGCLLKRVR